MRDQKIHPSIFVPPRSIPILSMDWTQELRWRSEAMLRLSSIRGRCRGSGMPAWARRHDGPDTATPSAQNRHKEYFIQAREPAPGLAPANPERNACRSEADEIRKFSGGRLSLECPDTGANRGLGIGKSGPGRSARISIRDDIPVERNADFAKQACCWFTPDSTAETPDFRGG